MSNLTFDSYSKQAMSFRLPSADYTYVVMGLVGEIGELYGSVAKSLRDHTPLERENLQKELGDILWFVTALTEDLGMNLGQVAEMNIHKLSARAVAGTIQGSGDNR